MTQVFISNPCIRCGKERITVRVYKEKVGESVVVHTETACPDTKCQSLVNKKLETERAQRERLVNINLQRAYTGGRRKKEVSQ